MVCVCVYIELTCGENDARRGVEGNALVSRMKRKKKEEKNGGQQA